MRNEDLKVIKKVANNVSDFEWHTLSSDNEYYKAIEFPVEAEENVNAFYSEIFSGITIVVGAYLSRFYYEEDKYSWEKKYYTAIVSTKTGKTNSIAFITSQDIESQNRKNIFFKGSSILGINDIDEENPISKLYDSVNRKVNEIDDLYSKFLEEE